jgi:hypothetical protein
MSQIFHRSANTIARDSSFGAVFIIAGLLGLSDEINRSPWVTQAQSRASGPSSSATSATWPATA